MCLPVVLPKDKRNVHDDFSRVILPVKAAPRSGRHRHTKPISRPPRFSPLWFSGFRLTQTSQPCAHRNLWLGMGSGVASDAPGKGGGPSPPRRNSEAQPLRPRENTARLKSAGRSDRPKRWQAPTPPRPIPTIPAPHTGLRAAPQPSTGAPPSTAGNLANTRGAPEETVGRVAASVPVLSGAPRPAPAPPPATDAQVLAGPAPPTPPAWAARRAARPLEARPTPARPRGLVALRIQNTLLSPEDQPGLKTAR